MTSQGSDRYKWIALANTTLAVLLATLDVAITIIAMPDIFHDTGLDPLTPSNSFYLLWMILGYMIVGSVLIVSLGRPGDMFAVIACLVAAAGSALRGGVADRPAAPAASAVGASSPSEAASVARI